MNRKTLAAIAAFLVALGTLLGALVDGDGGTATKTVTDAVVPSVIAVDSNGDGTPNKVIELGETAQDVAESAAEEPDKHDFAGDLRGKDATPVAQQTGPLATPNFPGCQTRILPTNWSNRTATVKAVAIHYTAGSNQLGLADMNGLTAFASSSSAGVSWHFLIDAEGHCYYSVPLDKKAWTIGNLNSQTVNIEVVGRGDEPTYPAGPAGARRLGQVVRRLTAIYHLPLRVGAVSNCVVTKTGVITHWMGGPCSGGHIDIRKYDIAKVVAAIAAGDCSTRCQRVAYIRGKHQRTHRRFVTKHCARRGSRGHVRHGYCDTLRRRNANMHRAARAEHISLAGTYG